MGGHSQLEWCCRRGTRELDLLLQTWLRQEFAHSTEAEQKAFRELLEWSDDALFGLLFGLAEAGSPILNDLARKIRSLPLSRP